MHIPLLGLGITPNSVQLARHLQKPLKLFNPEETEFFSDYTFFLDKTGTSFDPDHEMLIDEDLSDSRIHTMDTLLKYATGLSSEPALKELWSHFFADKSQKQVVKIDPDLKLVHAIGI